MKRIDGDCPTHDFKPGEPQGKCWGDGHYKCRDCKNYREDFRRLGQNYIDFAHNIQGQIKISSVNL